MIVVRVLPSTPVTDSRHCSSVGGQRPGLAHSAIPSLSDVTSGSILPRDALRWASRRLEANGIDSHARDARILLRHALGCTEEYLAGGSITALTPAQSAAFCDLIARRRRGEPVAYITGKKEFMGLEFAVDSRVLIPRPETEALVEIALALFGGSPTTAPLCASMLDEVSHPIIADIGAGSGAIAVSIARHLPHATIYATDASADALAVARANAEAHGVANRLGFLQGHYLQALPEPAHILVCNPPYIPSGDIPDLDADVRDYEPHLALSGGQDGLDAYRGMFPDLSSYLLPGGTALFEIGFDMAERLTALAGRYLPGARVDVYQDLAGFDRVLRISDIEPLGGGGSAH